MKIIILLLLTSFFSLQNITGQSSTNKLSSTLGENKLLTLSEIQKSFNDYWAPYNVKDGYYIENGVQKKAPGWKIFKRWEWYWEQRVNQITGEFPTTNSVIEYEKYLSSQNNLRKITYDESWTNLGTNSSTGGYAGIGRINCIAFHPTNANTFWVGSPSGGIWKTTTGGTSWTILNNNQLVIGVSAIVVDYTNPNVLYIATGDRDGGSMWSLGGGQAADNISIGVLKSTDGGVTWATTGLTYTTNQIKLIYSLVIHPSNNSILFAATSDGIYKTTDSGTNWTLKTGNVWNDIEFKPGDPTIMYAVSLPYSQTYINRSTNSGETWAFYSVAANGRRGEIAVTPNNPAVVYLLSANSSGGVFGVYKSTDSGVSFSVVNAGSPAGMLGYYTDGSGGSGGQGSYDWCIAVKPDDANTVFIGGITTWKSTDGGITFTANTNWTSYFLYNISGVPVVHADKHALVYQNNTILFEGNDGGIYKTTNGGTSWTDLSNGLVISQLYRIGVSQTSPTTVLTGLQDNGSKLYSGGFWSDVTGGDGMECIVDYSTTNYMYATYVRGTIYRSTNSGATFPVTISANIPGGQPTGAWVTPYIIDQNNSATLFAGYDRIWKTVDRGNNWTSASQVLSGTNKLRSLAIAPSNSNVLYAADLTSMWKTIDGGATNWTSIVLPALSGNSITYIAVKNNDPNTVWITCGGYTNGSKVFQSSDGGTNWTNISTGLPNLPVMCIVYYKVATDRTVLFVGTDLGVYVKDGTNGWVPFNTGLPSVVVTELEILYTGGINKLRAGTYGRGLWETNIDAALPVELSMFTAKVLKSGGVKLDWRTETEVSNYGFEVHRAEGNSDFQISNFEMIGFVEGHGNSNSPKDYSFTDNSAGFGKYSYRLKQIDTDGQFEYSKVIEVDAGKIPGGFVLEQNYPNPFNPSTTIKFALAETQSAKLTIYDVLGNEVAEPFNATAEGGKIYEAIFNAENHSSGIYFYRLETKSRTENRKMLLLK